jgi:hypothetical protein
VASEAITIPARFCGPPTSGNGGYTCGLLADAMGGEGPVEVMLRKPIPVETPMRVELRADGSAALMYGADVIAEGRHVQWELEEPPLVTFEQARIAEGQSPAFHNHPFPTCFVCGPGRPEDDGLRVYPGAVAGLERNGAPVFASTWIPQAEFADAGGNVRPEIIWASLDCPTGFAGGFPYEGKLVTGKLSTRLVAPVRAEQRCVLVSWRVAVEGRKHLAEAALVGADGELKAESRATWIKI